MIGRLYTYEELLFKLRLTKCMNCTREIRITMGKPICGKCKCFIRSQEKISSWRQRLKIYRSLYWD